MNISFYRLLIKTSQFLCGSTSLIKMYWSKRLWRGRWSEYVHFMKWIFTKFSELSEKNNLYFARNTLSCAGMWEASCYFLALHSQISTTHAWVALLFLNGLTAFDFCYCCTHTFTQTWGIPFCSILFCLLYFFFNNRSIHN